ncbi:MAG: hypothetical protein GC179_28485 [Anaerolineaceae bacterium]|nr:hypothetical protein [Anaerolineaceae bacterium]
MPQYFTANDIWNGGFYELALEFYPPSNQRLYSALQNIWKHPALDGCYRESSKEPTEQSHISPQESEIDTRHHLYGLITLPNIKQVACGTFQVREENGSDWLGFYVPMGALATAYDVKGFPFDSDRESHEVWRRELDDLLSTIGRFVFAASPFDLGLIDHECSGTAYAEDIRQNGIPLPSHTGYLWPENSNLIYYPRTSHY